MSTEGGPPGNEAQAARDDRTTRRAEQSARSDRAARRAERRRSFQRRRIAAVVAVLVAALLLARAVADDRNEPPPFAGPAASGQEPQPEPEPVRLQIAATGDFLIHEPVFSVALQNGDGERYDFRPMFAEIEPYVRDADLAICHVETPMTNATPTGFPVFNTPPDLARAISDTGWDACSTASNHSLDQGEEGVEQTIAALDREGIAHAGTAGSRAESRRPAIVDVEGVPVALLAYTEMTNGIPLPEPYSVNLAEAPRILADARAAREAGAAAVIVNLHAGDEYQSQPSQTQRRLAQRLTRSDDVTAVIGQHVHVPQPIDTVNGKVVVYGEGNLVSNQTAACCPAASQDGLIALLDLVVEGDEARVESARYVPVWVRHPDYTVLPVGEALETDEAGAEELRASYERTTEVVGEGPRIEPVPARLP